MSWVWELVPMIALLGASGALSAMETAFMSLSRVQLARLEKTNPGRLTFWREDPDGALTVILLGNNVVNAALGVWSASWAARLAESGGMTLSVAVGIMAFFVGLLVVVLGEVVPKALAIHHGESWALLWAPLLRLLTIGLEPLHRHVVDAMGVALSRISHRVHRGRAQWNAPVIKALLESAPLAPPLRKVVNNILDLGHQPVIRVMVPRLEIFTVDLRRPAEEVMRGVLGSGYSRVPAHRGSLDSVEGILYAKDFLAYQRAPSLFVMADLLRPILRVPDTTRLADLLAEFRQGHHHLALVCDRQGRIQGLVTLDDVLQALVGTPGTGELGPS